MLPKVKAIPKGTERSALPSRILPTPCYRLQVTSLPLSFFILPRVVLVKISNSVFFFFFLIFPFFLTLKLAYNTGCSALGFAHFPAPPGNHPMSGHSHCPHSLFQLHPPPLCAGDFADSTFFHVGACLFCKNTKFFYSLYGLLYKMSLKTFLYSEIILEASKEKRVR